MPTQSLSVAPVVDVARGVVAGFECTAPDGGACGPAQVAVALALRPARPENTFLSVALHWDALAEPELRSVLGSAASLGGVVLDIGGLRPSSPAGAAEAVTETVRAAGATIALRAVELWKPGFVWWMRLQPSFVVVEAEWTQEIGTASRRQFAVEAVERIAAQADAWLLAAHVGTVTEFDALVEFGVPLARGPFVGAPVELDGSGAADGVDWPPLSPEVLRALRPLPDRERGPLHDLLDTATVVETLLDARLQLVRDAATPVVLVDHEGRARWLISLAPDGDVARHDLLRLHVDTPAADAVLRALGRPEESRADPIAAVDGAGQFLGVVSMSRLVSLSGAAGTTPPDLYAAWSTIVDALPPR